MNKNIFFTILLSIAIISQLSAQATWTQKAAFGGGNVTEARAFSIGNFGYFGGSTADLWRYDPGTDSWSQAAMFPGPVRNSAAAFSIGNKGYLGTGGNFNDFYEYDAIANSWTQKANFGGSAREGALGISINGKGYIGTGGSYLNDWWEYDTTSNAWTQKANLAGPTRYHGGAFTIGNKGYVSTGFNGAFFNDLLEYDPALNIWTVKASLPGGTRDRPVGIGTATKGYILTGWTGSQALSDAWEYDPITDVWTQLPSMPTAGRYNSCGFSIGNKLYIGTGYMNGTVGDFWEFGPDCILQANSQPATCFGVCDGSATVALPDPAAVVSYLWSNGQTSGTVLNLCSGSYTVTVTDTTGCTSVTTVMVTAPPQITATAGITQPTCFGDSNGSLCAIPSVNPVSFLWAGGDTTACIQNIPAGTYVVTITDSIGCEEVIQLGLTEPGEIILNINHVAATCSTCPNGSASAQTTGGTSPYTYLWSTGNTLAFVNNLLPGTYSCCVTDVNNCVHCDSVVVGFLTAINENENNGVIISPNPFVDEIIIKSANKSNGKTTIKIFDITGKEVGNYAYEVIDKIIISTRHLTPGVYQIEIVNENGFMNSKMIKSK